jgi:hypothetical protein
LTNLPLMFPLQDTFRKPHIPSVYIHENLT